MKKIYLSIIASAFMLTCNAQLSLTKAFNEPVLGNVNSQHGYDTISAIPKNTGANQVWNFSSLTTNTIVNVGTYTTVASTPNGSSFASATLAESDGAGGYTYTKSTATQYELVGIVNPNISLNFSNNTAIIAIWPVTMGYSNTDPFSGTAVANGSLTGTATGTITTLGSGTGTLIIPGGATFTSILQVKTIQNTEISLSGGFITATVVAVDYNYYHSSQKFPLLTVSYSDIQGSFTRNTAAVSVNNNVLAGINDLNFDATFSIFPNPAKEYVNVKLNNVSNDVCKVEIVNSIGQLTKAIILGNDSEISNRIFISDLSAGMYMVKTTLGNKISTRKLIIE